MNYQDVSLRVIRINPRNPRKVYEGRNFDELVESIKMKGVIQPIVVRPISTMDEENGVIYEVVVGNRRFMASVRVSEERGYATPTIPAVIRNLSDDEAFEFMMIENLQREDLTDLEEAESFRGFIENRIKKGEADGAIAELGQKTGINPRYIRSRIAVLGLPKYILKKWHEGRLLYGHLEQFLRIMEAKKLRSFFQWTVGELRDDLEPVINLKARIDRDSPALKYATFARGECKTCPKNSAVQIALWDLGDEKALLCHDPKCFKKKQGRNLKENWKYTEFFKNYRTTGFRFREEMDWNSFSCFRGYAGSFKPDDDCKKCDNFVTLLSVLGKVDEAKACIDKACFARKESAWSRRRDPVEGKVDGTGPRVAWHGEYFREEFLGGSLPKRYELFGPADIKMARSALFAFVKLDNELLSYMAKEIKLKEHYLDKKLFERIGKMDLDEIRQLMQKCALKVIMKKSWPVSCEGRLAVATHLGINLKKEFAVTEEYLEKKTIREMLEFGKKSQLFKSTKMLVYLKATIGKKEFKHCKKTELVDVFLKSGVDLVGKVPAEILPARREI